MIKLSMHHSEFEVLILEFMKACLMINHKLEISTLPTDCHTVHLNVSNENLLVHHLRKTNYSQIDSFFILITGLLDN